MKVVPLRGLDSSLTPTAPKSASIRRRSSGSRAPREHSKSQTLRHRLTGTNRHPSDAIWIERHNNGKDWPESLIVTCWQAIDRRTLSGHFEAIWLRMNERIGLLYAVSSNRTQYLPFVITFLTQSPQGQRSGPFDQRPPIRLLSAGSTCPEISLVPSISRCHCHL